MLTEQDRRDMRSLVQEGNDAQIVILLYLLSDLEAGHARRIGLHLALAERYRSLAASRQLEFLSSTPAYRLSDPLVLSWYKQALTHVSAAIEQIESIRVHAHVLRGQISVERARLVRDHEGL